MFRSPSQLAAALLVVLLLSVSSGTAAAAPPSWSNRSGHPDAAVRAGPLAHVTLTTRTLSSALEPRPSLRFDRLKPAPGSVMHVDAHTRYQRIDGFGAAMTDTSAWLINTQLPPEVRAALMRSFFSDTGIHLSFMRVPIGASDFTATGVPYSYDDLPPGQTDPELTHFSIAHDLPYIVPALRAMLAINPTVRILATPWSPPPWMKANGAFDNLGGHGSLLPRYAPALAAYFVKFIESYRAEGIPISAITPQNEPGAQPPFPGMNLSAADEASFVAKNLRPALAAAKLRPTVYGLDRGAVVNDALELARSGSVTRIAWHCYGGQLGMAALHAAYPRVGQIISECSPGIIPYMAAEAAIAGMRNWASAVELWNLALDPSGGPVEPKNFGCSGCTGLATVSEQTHTASLGRNFYELGQLSKFVMPGAVRIFSERFVSDFRTATGTYGVTPGLDDVAFRNPDGTKVLVVYNNSAQRRPFSVGWRNRYLGYALGPRSTVTFVWR
jgi:glucosylceramidase